jgi:putative aldouronate transport system substrate-binding protein
MEEDRMKNRLLVSIMLALAVSSLVMAGGAKSSAPQASGSGPVELDMFIDFTWFETDSWTGIIPEEITRKTGVRPKITRAVDNNQLGMMIASGNLPDLIFTEPQLGRLASPDFAYSYNELIAKYTPEWQPDPMLIGNSKLLNKPGDNNYYFLLTAFSTEEKWKKAAGPGNMPSIVLRQDILDELGNPPIRTFEDFENVLGMVKARYPNMIPYLPRPQATWGSKALRTSFGVSNDAFVEENGKVSFYTNARNYRRYLEYINGLYRKGYLMADSFSLTESDCKSMFQNGQVFAMSQTTTGEGYSYGEMVKSVKPGAYAREIFILNPDTKFYNAGTGWAGVVITKNCKNPEAAIKFMQYLWTLEGMRLTEWGREGIEWNMGSDGLPVFSAEWLEAAKDRPLYYSKYNPHYFISMDMVVEVDGRMAELPADYREVYKQVGPYIYVCPWIGAATPKQDGPERNILTKLNDMTQNDEVKCFLAENDGDFNRYYQEIMANAKTIGVDQLETYMNREVQRYRPLYQ